MFRRDGDLAGGMMGAALRDYGGRREFNDFGQPPPRNFGYGEEPRMRSFSPPPGHFGPRGPPMSYYRERGPPRDTSPQWLPRYGSPERRQSPPRRYGPPRDVTPPRRYGYGPPREPSPPRRQYNYAQHYAPPNPYSGPPGRYRDSGFNFRDESPGRRHHRSDQYDSDEDRRRFDEETREQLRYSRSPVRRRPGADYSGGWY